MKVYQSEYNKNHLHFVNLERVDEEIFFKRVYNILDANSKVVIGEKKIGPSEDYYNCKVNGKPFTLFYDIDDGVLIYCDDVGAMQKLIEVLQD